MSVSYFSKTCNFNYKRTSIDLRLVSEKLNLKVIYQIENLDLLYFTEGRLKCMRC